MPEADYITPSFCIRKQPFESLEDLSTTAELSEIVKSDDVSTKYCESAYCTTMPDISEHMSENSSEPDMDITLPLKQIELPAKP